MKMDIAMCGQSTKSSSKQAVTFRWRHKSVILILCIAISKIQDNDAFKGNRDGKEKKKEEESQVAIFEVQKVRSSFIILC